jgi:hypothetical protein
VQAEQVAHHECEPSLAVVEDEAARVQFVVDMFGRYGANPPTRRLPIGGVMLLVAASAGSRGAAGAAARAAPATTLRIRTNNFFMG